MTGDADGTVVTDPEDPPSPGPRAAGGDPPDVHAADERTDDGDPDVRPDDLARLARLLGRVLAAEGAPATAEASLRLVDRAEIAALAREHLGGDGSPTDVLSFPVDGVEATAELVGDVVVCPAVAVAQAPSHAGSAEDEMALLVVHAGLHLAGWDHATDTDRDAMWARERDLLVALHGPPAADPWKDAS